MKAFLPFTRRFFAEIWSAAMLAVLAVVPIFMGIAFHFGVPELDEYICAATAQKEILAPYYAIFDLLLSTMTPIMFTAAGALVILDDPDCCRLRGLDGSSGVVRRNTIGHFFARRFMNKVLP